MGTAFDFDGEVPARRISSKWTYFYKRVFPRYAVICPPLMALSFLLANRFGFGNPMGQEQYIVLLVVSIILPIAGYLACRYFVLDLVDEAWDAGDAIVVKKDGITERIPFMNCLNVHWNIQNSPPRMTIHLKVPCTLGSEVAFMLPFSLMPRFTPPLARELIERIEATRQIAARQSASEDAT